MRITTEQLPQHLARELKALYTVYGDETLLALEASDRVRARARAEGYSERQVITADSGFRWSELAFAGNSQSLFAARRILELRVPPASREPTAPNPCSAIAKGCLPRPSRW